MWLTVGAQAQVLHGLTFTVGLDVALRSVGFPYGPPLAPWNMIFGASYPLDLVPRVVTRVVPVEKVVTVEKPAAPNEGYVVGKVVSTTGTPVEGAIIGAVGREHSRVASDADGTFRSVGLASGPVELVITANTHETATVKADVVAGQTVNLAVTLTPRSPAARAAGRIADETGKGVTANVKLAGPQLVEGKADESGVFSIPVLPGQYVMRIEADQYLSKELPLNVVEGPENPVAITLHARPAVAGVVYAEGKLTLRQPITFKMAGRKPTAELTPGMPLLLDEIIDVLVNHPEIRQIRIEAHTDSSLPPAKAQALTDQQAKAVADYLVAQGIPRERVAPAGMGSSKPLVPNLGKAGRAKNRRVELVVVN
jgi:outer membrane protein OmpA-like peptidoglycan-associated protein